jgi:Right handed beta helix region
VKHTTLVIVASVLVVLAGHGTASAAASFYVDSVNGNDSNPGTQSAPWQSLTRANKQSLAPGDSLLLKRGSFWSGQELQVSENGTSAARIKVDAYATGAAPVISTASSCAMVTGDYVTVRNLKLDNCSWAGIQFAEGSTFGLAEFNILSHNIAGAHVSSGASDNTIQNNTIVDNNKMKVLTPCPPECNNDNGAWGILLNGDRNLVANNQISGSDSFSYDYGRDGAAVEVYNGASNTIQRNKAIDNETFSELGGAATRDNTFLYNSVRSAISQGKFVVLTGVAKNTTLTNNSVYLTGTSSQGIVCSSGCNTGVLHSRNNLIKAVLKAGYADAPFDDAFGVYSGFIQFALGANSLAADPKFRSLSDLRVEATSPAVDSGASLGYTADINAETVPQDNNNDGVKTANRGSNEALAPPTQCPDFTRDRWVDISDLLQLTNWYGRAAPPAPANYDVNHDGYSDIIDVSYVSSWFGRSC